MNNHATTGPHDPDMPERPTNGADGETGGSAPNGPDHQAGRNDAPFPGAPANVWLCYPTGSENPTGHEPRGDREHDREYCGEYDSEYGGECEGGEDPPGPIWARRTVEAFSRPGDRVIIRAAGSYLGVAGETVALIGAATATGRRPVALLPTVAIAARTRALLPPPDLGGPQPHLTGLPTPAPTAPPTPPPTVPPPAPTVPNPPDTSGLGPPRRVPVGVGRRRPGLEAAPAALVVVLSGPVTPGARPVRRRITPRLWASWARPLRPGGMLVVARPPELGARAARRVQPHAELITAAGQAGLVYVAHIVLVHAPTTHTGLAHPSSTRRPHAPFWPAHTDLLAFRRSEDYDPTDPTPLPFAPSAPASRTHVQDEPSPNPAPRTEPDAEPDAEPGSLLDNASDTARDTTGDRVADQAAHRTASATTQPIPACPPPWPDRRGITSTVYPLGSGRLTPAHPDHRDPTRPDPASISEPSSSPLPPADKAPQSGEIDEAASATPPAPDPALNTSLNTAPGTARDAVASKPPPEHRPTPPRVRHSEEHADERGDE